MEKKQEQIKTATYTIGYVDGSKNTIDILIKLKLLKPGWKDKYNKEMSKSSFLKIK